MVVVLPAPLWPRRPHTVPTGTEKLTPRSAGVPPSNVFVRSYDLDGKWAHVRKYFMVDARMWAVLTVSATAANLRGCGVCAGCVNISAWRRAGRRAQVVKREPFGARWSRRSQPRRMTAESRW